MTKRFQWQCLLLLAGMLLCSTAAYAQNQAAVSAALNYVVSHADALGLTAADVEDMVVTDAYTSQHNGVTHVYLNQRHQRIGVHNALLNVNVTRGLEVASVGNRFVADLASKVSGSAGLAAPAAVAAAAQHLGLPVAEPLDMVEVASGAERASLVSDGGFALENIPARLVYQPLDDGTVALAWSVGIYTRDAQHYWNVRVDAASGAVLAQDDLVVHDDWGRADNEAAEVIFSLETGLNVLMNPDSYNVFPLPAESPEHPAGGPGTSQTIVTNPADGTASPFGWHDTNGAAGAEFTDTRGNNVDAYADRNGDNSPDGSRPSGGGTLDFNEPIDLNQQPSTYIPGAVVNLFYWNNIIHDVVYRYGFDEASGNFQVNNYGNGGLGNDDVRAEAQDNDLGGANCNANFFTPSDGNRPRMQMFTCNNTTPERDGDLDNGVIVHEYGHGISNRLTGGPSASGCLGNQEQMGEGWSDWFALILTQQPGDTGLQARGIGTYLFGQPANGPGIRARPYSTDFGVNEFTYDNIKTASVPHGVGHVWATMLWDLNWALIGGGDDGAGGGSGYDPDLYGGNGGNNLALQLVTDGMKLQPCGPGFVDGRDAILLADDILTGDGNPATPDGANWEIIWNVFADRGLGWSASQGSSNSVLDGTEAFDLPPCLGATSMHVESITTGTQGRGKRQRGTATVTIHCDLGDPLAGAVVSGTFGGSFSEPASGTTDANGQVTLVTAARASNPEVTFCVDDVSGDLDYVPSDNTLPAYACGGGTPGTDVHVQSIATGQQGAGGRTKRGTATVTIFDDTNSPVGAGYTVTGDFSGDFTETGLTAVTNGSGVASFETTGTKKGKVKVDFCVDDVSGTLPYDPNDNAPGTTCPGSAAKRGASSAAPDVFALEQNYPNPFNPTTEIGFQLPEAVHVRLAVYDVMGREVARLVDGPKEAGVHAVTFDAGRLPSGTYFYRITAGDFVRTQRMVLMK